MEQVRDATFEEMTQQMQQLREALGDQKIINERILKRSYRRDLSSLRAKSSRIMALAVVAMALSGHFCRIGFSLPFFIATELMLLGCLVATLLVNRHIPSMDCDLVSAAEELGKFKLAYVNWLRIGIPAAAFWLSWMTAEIFIRDFPDEFRIPFLAGIGVGVACGLSIGLRMRREIIRSTEELLSGLESLRETA